ncbi:MAG TPA: NADP-dependent malic enzyme [Hyphomonadaceae bacterium]|jgi:malate dehydrogenase (oxaloacetate-decarboxylating)(NADP+)|nr:NADP-dependent malic enzyme [Hyphomonadaceae bacterium]
MTSKRPSLTDEEALAFHKYPRPGKLSVTPTKPMATQKDLSLAYSPGVAIPVLAIAKDPDLAYDYTSKGNLVAVITNGTAILGLGDLGPLASKPVMEGKSVLFKRFADVDSIDIEVDEKDPQKFIDCVRAIGATFGGINLEDIKAPECFIIESELRSKLDIPVFHDDQHGTAIIATAGLINACEITGRKLADVKVVISGAGAAGLSVAGLIRHLGVKRDNILMVDRTGVIYEGRQEGMDQFKSGFAVKTKKRTLAEAFEGADVFMGLSAKGTVNKAMVKSMAKNPMIFPMANPDPEITPEEIREVRSDAIIATGRSDYPNQINNVLGFPYIFRGALDVRARTINEEMKVAAAKALAQLAREDVPDEVAAAYAGARPTFGPEYIIPAPFDPRLIWYVPPLVAQAAMDTGVARKPIEDMNAYRDSLAQRLDPSASFLQRIHGTVRREPARKRIVFAEGEEPAVIRAAWQFKTQELGEPILVGREDQIARSMQLVGVTPGEIKVINARSSDKNAEYTDYLYKRLQRKGYLLRDAQRMINQDRNIFAAVTVAMGHADGLVTGVTRNYATSLDEIQLAIDPRTDVRPIGISIVIGKQGPMVIADTSVTEMPGAQDLAEIAISAARAAQRLGFTPKLAFVSYSTFGNPPGERMEKVREAVAILDRQGNVGFEYDGEMAVDVALNPDARRLYPFARLTGPANVLVMPAIHSAAISTKMAAALGGATVIGPLLVGLKSSIQIAQLDATAQDIVNLAAFAAYNPNA